MSLEWQFYLIAPLVIWLCKTPGRALGLVLAVASMSILYHYKLAPLWERPSMLIGTAKFFLIGIGCRFASPMLVGRVEYVAAIGAGLGFTALWIGEPAIAAWLVVYSFVLRSMPTGVGFDRHYTALMRAALESRPIQLLAERSYSTYLLHFPVMTIIGAIATSRGVPTGLSLGIVMMLAIPLTLILQEPIYRFVEVPSRNLGKRWAKGMRQPCLV